MIILIGEGGGGKTAILNELEKRGFEKAINYTTRHIRETEKENSEYKFVNKEEFNKMWKQGKLLQRAEFANEYYGISINSLKENIACISIVDSIKDIKTRANELGINNVNIITFYIYVKEQERINRMRKRGDTEENIQKRILKDLKKFKNAKSVSDYIVENNNLEKTVEKIIYLTTKN